jgi:hypothetical protein
MKTMRLFPIVFVSLFVVSCIIIPTGGTIPSSTETLMNSNASILSNSEYSNVTALWEQIWSQASVNRFRNDTKTISENYPAREWDSFLNKPTENLSAACNWANMSLTSATSDNLVFHNVTDYDVLYAVKEGTLPAPRSVIMITGIIDSGNSPGANDVAVSVAAVLEVARILDGYSLPFDVYYVLSTAGRSEYTYDPAARAFVQWIEDNSIDVLYTMSFDRLLFHLAGYPYGRSLALRYNEDSVYQRSGWLTDLMIEISASQGVGRLLTVPDLENAQRSFAAEMWAIGEPAVHIAQGYYPDSHSGDTDDIWDGPDYSYNKALEGVTSVASAIVYMADLAGGIPAAYYKNGPLLVDQEYTQTITTTYLDLINVTITWPESATVYSEIVNVEQNMTVYSRTENDGKIVMKYLPSLMGYHFVRVLNTGPNNITIHLNITYHNDIDGDSLSDQYEASIGTNIYSKDTDGDSLDDALEVSFNSDPTSNDTDHDGASDFEEYQLGSSLISNDTDHDGLLDGVEVQLGTNLLNPDTDSDGISDWDEVEVYLTNPRRKDSDRDGLEDGFEIDKMMNPLSSDSDNDSLSDLFEVLNGLNPLSGDSDNDGWGDAYEVEHCMLPTNPDTDQDGIPDGIDWDPQVHWIAVVAPVSVLSLVALMGSYGFLKWRVYKKEDAAEEAEE